MYRTTTGGHCRWINQKSRINYGDVREGGISMAKLSLRVYYAVDKSISFINTSKKQNKG